jgi:hypothetical protein
LKDADWHTKRELVRALVHRIEIGPTKMVVVLRLPMERRSRVRTDYGDIVRRERTSPGRGTRSTNGSGALEFFLTRLRCPLRS